MDQRDEIFMAEMLADEMQCRKLAASHGEDAAGYMLRFVEDAQTTNWVNVTYPDKARFHATLAWGYARRAMAIEEQLTVIAHRLNEGRKNAAQTKNDNETETTCEGGCDYLYCPSTLPGS